VSLTNAVLNHNRSIISIDFVVCIVCIVVVVFRNPGIPGILEFFVGLMFRLLEFFLIFGIFVEPSTLERLNVRVKLKSVAGLHKTVRLVEHFCATEDVYPLVVAPRTTTTSP
jgi:hypothetical protein